MSAAETVSAPVIMIRPGSGSLRAMLRELWASRELASFLLWRDLTVRYRQTALGAAWAILQPLLTMVVFSLFFGGLAKMPSDGIPYPLFAYCGLLPWQLFAHALMQSSTSLVSEQQLLKKVYFPRVLIPLVPVLTGLVDFSIAFLVLLGMMAYYGVMPTSAVWMLPGFLGLAVLSALAVGLWLSALNVQYRDVRYTVPLLTQVWLVATPIAYPSSLVPPQWHWLYGLNPMAGVVEGFRWALLGTSSGPGVMLPISCGATVLLLLGGLCYFRRMERVFADIV